MERYDPFVAPDPKEWLSLDEQDRFDRVNDYHRRARIDLPNAGAHTVAHVIVENQIALGEKLNVERTLRRLMAEGLDRHDGLHAIASVLIGTMNEAMRYPGSESHPNEEYAAALERLTAEAWLKSADEPLTEEELEIAPILDELVMTEGFPKEAITAARARRASAAPMFLEFIDEYLAAKPRPAAMQQALFFIFHLLGEWREKTAYRALARLLRLPADESDSIFGEATTATSHRVMAAVFDGDPEPLYDVILDPEADEFIRSRMCEVLAMLTLRGELPRAEAERFLRAGYSNIKPQQDCYVWNGWQNAIAALGLVELKPLVEQAFKRGCVDPLLVSFKDFEKELQWTIKHPATPWRDEDEYTLFGDTIDELSNWAAFTPDNHSNDGDHFIDEPQWSPNVPAANPFKDIGRNDPCPCGSGKKFKKCCLT